jgi:hypothetical protein
MVSEAKGHFKRRRLIVEWLALQERAMSVSTSRISASDRFPLLMAGHLGFPTED